MINPTVLLQSQAQSAPSVATAAPTQPSPIPQPAKKHFLPVWAIWLIGAVFIIAILLVGLYVSMRLATPDELVIENQPIETEVRVKRLRVSKPGFLVIYQLKNTELVDGVVAKSFYLFPETYTDFAFPLSPDVDAKTLADNLFIGVLYEDTNNSWHWDLDKDKVVKTIFGKQVKSLFRNTAIPDVMQ